jgi:H+/Cl- antiporter ClcA
MKNPHRESRAKKIAIIVAVVGVVIFFIAVERHYGPSMWPRGSTSDWNSWDWCWATLLVVAGPFAVAWRIRDLARVIIRRQNRAVRNSDYEAKHALRGESND